jgi:two-component sensor histidine kinase
MNISEHTGGDDGLSLNRRKTENRLYTIFFLAFLAFCAAFALVKFSFYVWTIELACAVILVAIFMFAFNIKEYSVDSSSLYSGAGFLFTFVFAAAYLYITASSGERDFRLAPAGLFFYVSMQWYLAFTFLIILYRKRPSMRLSTVIATCSAITAALLSFHFLLPNVELQLVSRHRSAYVYANVAGLAALYGYMLWKLVRAWGELPEYFAARTFASLVATSIGALGVLLTLDSGPVLVFAFYFLRFVGLSLCYNANVAFILLPPYRALYGQLSSRADELSEANVRLKAALDEKEVLLGEIHHRVKNNLQVVSSLLSLQSGQVQSEEFREAFLESQNRIRAMSLVHEMLYQDKNFAAIDFADYLKRISGELLYSSGRTEIRGVMDCESVHVPIDAAITCSLIVNELITNCLKHAFPRGRAGTVSVRLRPADSIVELEVGDDGVGLPLEFDVAAFRSMGFSLVTSLVSQLRGELDIEGTGGTCVRIRFPNAAPAQAGAASRPVPTSSRA